MRPNLLDSVIIELLEYVRKENVKALVTYIGIKHLKALKAARREQRVESTDDKNLDTILGLELRFEQSMEAPEQTSSQKTQENQVKFLA